MSKELDEMFPKVKGAPSEQEMRDTKAPTPADLPALSDYIKSLVERPHDYGTCVYAMSLAATAAFNFVASKLGVTGFQASCADLDILKRTRGLERFRIIDFGNLLYPQYCDDDHFPSWREMLKDPEIAPWLRDEAKRRLAESGKSAHPNVLKHWKALAASAVKEPKP